MPRDFGPLASLRAAMPPRKKQKKDQNDDSVPPPAEDSRLAALRLSLASSTRDHSAELHDAANISEDLLAWYDKVFEDRAMPWRKTASAAELKARDQATKTQRAYEVWQTMCQQTQASRVVAYYNRWLETFPTLESLAEGSLDKVRELWQGLGYYSRGTRLLEGAKVVMNEYDGRIPETAAKLVKLPGIGPYTAGAVASIAFGEAVPAVDGNVERVLSRAFVLYGPAAAKATKKALSDLAAELVPSDRPGDFNQALMDLGFSICKPRDPNCPSCPLADRCLAYAELRTTEHPAPTPEPVEIESCEVCAPMEEADLALPGPSRYPMPKVRKAPKEESTGVLVLESSDRKRVLLIQRPETGLLAGQWELVAVDLPSGASETKREKMLAARLAEVLGKSTKLSDLVDRTQEPEVVHRFTHQLRTYIPDSARLEGPDIAPGKRARWATRDEIAQLPLGKAQRLIWEAHLAGKKRSAITAVKRQRKAAKVVELEIDDDEEEIAETAAEDEAEASGSGTSDDDAPVPARVYTPRRSNGRKTTYVEDRHSEEDRRSAADSDFAVRCRSSALALKLTARF